MLHLEKSAAAFAEAKHLMPGGVNSPVRSYANVDCNPPFIDHGLGDKIYDIDGNEYIDYVGSWGPLVVGHAHPQVVKALQEAAARGTSYGAPTLIESELAQKVMEVYPSIEMLRMVNSGTEATMSALRLARGYTHREKIVKFIGCYHGHSDSLLVNAGSGMATFGVPSSPGVTKGTAADTISVPYNDIDALQAVMDECGDEIAAVIVEPVAGNMGCVLPKQGYLRQMRALTEKHGTLPRILRRCAGGLWHHARPHLPRQDHRRWPARGGLWRPPRDHAAGQSDRSGLSGGHALGQSAGDDGGSRDAEAHHG